MPARKLVPYHRLTVVLVLHLNLPQGISAVKNLREDPPFGVFVLFQINFLIYLIFKVALGFTSFQNLLYFRGSVQVQILPFLLTTLVHVELTIFEIAEIETYFLINQGFLKSLFNGRLVNYQGVLHIEAGIGQNSQYRIGPHWIIFVTGFLMIFRLN